MIKKLLVMLGIAATFMAVFTTTVGACAAMFGETRVPEALQKDL